MGAWKHHGGIVFEYQPHENNSYSAVNYRLCNESQVADTLSLAMQDIMSYVADN